jgi:hypothetical protein
VLSDDRLDLVVLSGQPIYYQPFEYQQLNRAGLWDPSDLSASVHNQTFPLIVVGGMDLPKDCCWPAEVSAAIRNGYSISERPSGLRVYQPQAPN